MDFELEKRITLIQRIFRKKEKNSLTYEVPFLDEKKGYTGYRETVHYCRWNRKGIFKLLKYLLQTDRHNCIMVALCDVISPNDLMFF